MYPIRTRGISDFRRNSTTDASTVPIVAPFSIATCEECWIVTPSAIGSENGIPTSMRLAPAFSKPRINGTVAPVIG